MREGISAVRIFVADYEMRWSSVIENAERCLEFDSSLALRLLADVESDVDGLTKKGQSIIETSSAVIEALVRDG
jgi:hypothetical protein